MNDDITRAFGAPLHERIEAAIGHAIAHDQMRKALWPVQPFAMSLGELLREAASVAELEAEVQRLRADAERWRGLYRRAVNEANGLTNYVDDRPELRAAERKLEAIQADARAAERKEG